MKNEEIEKLYEALEKSSFTVAITGAGISIAAGGVSFAGMFSRMGPAVIKHSDPDKTYKSLYRTFLKSAFENGPTIAHRALAKLEEMGKCCPTTSTAMPACGSRPLKTRRRGSGRQS